MSLNQCHARSGRWDELQSGYGRDGRAGGNSGATGFERNQLFGVQESGDDRQRYREEGDATRGLDNHGMLERQQQIMRGLLPRCLSKAVAVKSQVSLFATQETSGLTAGYRLGRSRSRLGHPSSKHCASEEHGPGDRKRAG